MVETDTILSLTEGVFSAERDLIPTEWLVPISTSLDSTIEAVSFTSERDYISDIWPVLVDPIVITDESFFTSERDFIPDEWLVSISTVIETDVQDVTFTSERDLIPTEWPVSISTLIETDVQDVTFTSERDFIPDEWPISISDIVTSSIEDVNFTSERDLLPTVWLIQSSDKVSSSVEDVNFTAEIDWIIDNITREYTLPVDGTGSIFILNTFDDGAVIDTEYYTLEQPGAPIGINGGDENSPAMTFAHGVYHTFNLGNYSQGETGEVLSWPDEHFTFK